MKRFVWSAGGVGFVALAGAVALSAITLAQPRGLQSVDNGIPAVFIVLDLMRLWLPVLVIVGFGCIVSIWFALAANWNTRNRNRSVSAAPARREHRHPPTAERW